MKHLQQLLTIREVSEHLGLPKSTIRFWEKEFASCILPQRTPGGQRRYCSKDVELLELIANLKEQGMTINAIKRQLANHKLSKNGLDSSAIDLLANRIAGAVHREIITFFSEEFKLP
jgi:DNA-binding transcriptional MerR regulator